MSRIKDAFFTDKEAEAFQEIFEPDLEPEIDRLMWEQREMEADPGYIKYLEDLDNDNDQHSAGA